MVGDRLCQQEKRGQWPLGRQQNALFHATPVLLSPDPSTNRAFTSISDSSSIVVFSFDFTWSPSFLEKLFPLNSATPCSSEFFPHMSTSQWLPIVLRITPNAYPTLLAQVSFITRFPAISALPKSTLPHDLCPSVTWICFQTLEPYSHALGLSYMLFITFSLEFLQCLYLVHACLSSNFSSKVTS